MHRIIDINKLDQAIEPISLATTSATSEYYPAAKYRQFGFLFGAAAMAATKTVVAQILQATDAAGTGSKNVTSATCTITANTNVKSGTLTLASVVAAETVVINGITFTAHATTTTVANREFHVGVSDTADAAELVTCINDATYGVPGVTASSALGVVTLVATTPGEIVMTLTGDTHITAATLAAVAYIEIDSCLLDTNNGFEYAAIKLTTDDTILCNADLIRESPRYTPTQYLACSYTNP